MTSFIQNTPNKELQNGNFNIHKEYSISENIILAIIWIFIAPAALVIALFSKLFLLAFITSGTAAFYLVDKITGRNKADSNRKDYTFQGVRAYINNRLANSIPHINPTFRCFLLRITGINIGKEVFIGMNGYMDDMAPQNVIIEDDATISFEVTFIGHGPKKDSAIDKKFIILRSGCYVGARAVILPGVEIGKDAVVGAATVVSKSVPPGAIVVGSPCKIIGWRENYAPDSAKAQGLIRNFT